jgi:NitT/TauT family transport system permease protein
VESDGGNLVTVSKKPHPDGGVLTSTAAATSEAGSRKSAAPGLPDGRTWQERLVESRRAIYFGRLLLLVLLLGSWQMMSGTLVPEFWISDPVEIVSRLYEWFSTGYIYPHLSITLQETALGFLLGASAGVVSGIVLALNRPLGRLLDPFISAFYGLPKYALAPLFILWLGIDLQMKVVLTATIVFFEVFWSTFAGVRAASPELLNVLQVMGASLPQRLSKVILPGALPYIYVGLKIGVPSGLRGAVVGELIASNRGLGFILLYSAGNFDVTSVMAGVIVLGVLAATLNAILNKTEGYALGWKKRTR